MRLERFAQYGWWTLLAGALVANGCAGETGQLFESGGRSGTSAGGAESGASSTGGASNGAGHDAGGADDNRGGNGNGGQSSGGQPSGGEASAGETNGGEAGSPHVGAGGLSGRGGAPFAQGGAHLGAGGTLPSGGATLGNGGKAGAPNPTSEITLKISKNTDDCTWIQRSGDYEERLRYSESDTWIEVGNDTEQGRIGLRFTLPVPAKATIVSATLQLQRLGGSMGSTDTLFVQVYDTGDVPAFDATHRHGPAMHAALLGMGVRGTLAGDAGKSMTSADVKTLVQHVVDRPDFGLGDAVGTIGFVISPDMADGWASYGDSSTGAGASLRLSYRATPAG